MICENIINRKLPQDFFCKKVIRLSSKGCWMLEQQCEESAHTENSP